MIKITKEQSVKIREDFIEGINGIKSIEMSARGGSIYMTVDREKTGITEYEIVKKGVIDLSFTIFNDGIFQVYVKNDEHEVMLEGKQSLSKEDFEFLNEVAPGCVFSKYKKL